MGRSVKIREKHTRIKKLRCFRQVHEMLAHGHPAPHVAQFIVDQGESDDITEESLTVALKLYRRDILPRDVITNRAPHIIVEAAKAYTDKLEELRRFDLQYEALLYRFDLAHARERAGGFIDPQVDKIQKSIGDVLRQMHIIKMDLGISGQRNLGTLTIAPERLERIEKLYGDKAAKALANPVSRARVMHAFELMRKAHYKKLEEEGLILDAEFEQEFSDGPEDTE